MLLCAKQAVAEKEKQRASCRRIVIMFADRQQAICWLGAYDPPNRNTLDITDVHDPEIIVAKN